MNPRSQGSLKPRFVTRWPSLVSVTCECNGSHPNPFGVFLVVRSPIQEVISIFRTEDFGTFSYGLYIVAMARTARAMPSLEECESASDERDAFG